MKAVVKTAPARGAEFHSDWAEAECRADEVRIQIAAASVCGTDRELFEYTDSAKAFGLAFPVVLGHELSGTVIETGKDVRSVMVGDRVALESHLMCGHCFPCRTGNAHNCENLTILGMHFDGAFAERVVVPERICFKLPEALPLESGALLEPAGVAMHAVQRAAQTVPGQRVLISGSGPVGMVLSRLVTLMGASDVVVIEPNPYRRQLAADLGAHTLTPDDDIVAFCRDRSGDHGGFDVAFEVSGAASALPTLFDATRREGTIVTVGHPGRPIPIDIAQYINKKGITLRGVFGRRLWDTWESIATLVSSGQLDLGALVTNRLPLEEFEHAIDLLTQDSCKVLLIPESN
ncbi:L-threonine 3-dehydrogenase [Curtobacterium sp. MCPF17_018]|nr:L-threonine 3-dehydrogenase [Curtobacterium sp. MCPF17_018]